jgi:hypothetical protein
MKISTDKLLVLKAFYLGHRIRDAVDFKDAAITMVNHAISNLEHKHSHKDKTRMLFYYLILCELLRGNDDVFKYRLIAKNLAGSIDKENVYSDYMSIVNETDSKLKIYGINKGFMFKQSIKSYKNTLNSDVMLEWDNDLYWRGAELPFPAIGVSAYDLTERQSEFINSCSLKDVMSSHNISYH